MGAVLIGVGLAIAVIGLVLGAAGFGSSETTSGAALFTVGSIGFVGGLLFLGLGFVHRALVDIAQRLDGIVHLEPEEDTVTEAAAVIEARDDFSAAFPPLVDKPAAATVRAPEPEPVFEPEPAVVPEAEAEVEEPKPARGGLPSWFRRKRETEPEAEAGLTSGEAPDFEPRVAPGGGFDAPSKPDAGSESPFHPDTEARRELPAFLRTGAAAPAERPAEPRLPDLRFGEPRVTEPRVTEPRAPEPRAAEPPTTSRDEFEPGPPPTFLRESDLLGDDEPVEPEITVLKAGTIGGMAYKLYSDGSIEADLPDGTLRFASLQELREHVAGSAARGEG